MELFIDTYDLISNNRELYYKIYQLLEQNISLSLNDLIVLLRENGFNCQENQVIYILYHLISREQRVIRNDYWNKTPRYQMLEPNLFQSRFQNYYFSLEDNNVVNGNIELDKNVNKIFLLISDVHIGSNIFNAKLLHNLYDYAISNGATKTFLLGDLFDGLKKCNSNEKEEFIRQINLFKEYYPSPSIDEMITYANIGNHDRTMNEFMMNRTFLTTSDLRNLTIYNPSFYMFLNDPFGINGHNVKINSKNFHLNHELFMSPIIENHKMLGIDDIKNVNLLDTFYDVLISGHLHKGIIYSINNDYFDKERLYLGVPSTSSLNVGKDNALGYLIYMFENYMEISILGCDIFFKVSEIDRIRWNFDKKNNSYCKVL